ncbi:MAG: MotA/TolQ/ExbB proton channel family protein [Desulfobacteraceae bacterium]|uniref:MotA/TolQ/ExbB proton channel family protein n=1 Tax=Candidatus Desulfacyla euxinica TaxID=2841693 RepID=A0A8J6T7I3_9DELT|nr:MotA/TolQ/ExbB proton channel family protein [Candidatus Desulfacyla euxinica]MBL6978350.1 MotA/TolQ/ExbB proton channel family protein [Desulfobacteraceae bacterium]HIJ58884.1 Tol-Pal system subunit TolQ [Deltaproteobacteria bacterium]
MISIPFINMIPAGVSFEAAFGQDIVQMVVHAGPMVKFVLLVLGLFSVTSWAIIFMKYRLLRKARFETIDFLDLFWESKDLKKVYMESKALNFSPVARLFRAGYAEFTRFRNLQSTYSDERRTQSGRQDGRPGDGEPSQTRRALMDNLERSLRKATIDQNKRLELSLSFLATTGNTTPFIGLFGTVWGIMEAFRGIGMKGSASLAVVAPGISEALIATAAGLAAAIPAVVAFNYFSQRVVSLQAEMDIFTTDFLSMVGRQFIKKT